METITSCRVCKSCNIRKFFNLGNQPLANHLLEKPTEKENFYSLSLSWCQDCGLVQLNETIDPKELFSQYVWVTATSKTAKDYSQIFCEELVSRSPAKGFVLEIASNDGTFLKPFVKNGYKVLGVDPAENIAEEAISNGIPTRCSFFGSEDARKILAEKGPAQIIFARNVLPHVANTRDFVEGLGICLAEEGTLAIEAHYAKQILEELHYDSIYHEHLCYFTLKTLEKLLNDFGLHVFDIMKSPISGGSIVVFAKKQKVSESWALREFREKENESKVNELSSWEEFAKRSYSQKEQLLGIINDFLKKGKTIAGYGASARSSTMLNFCAIDSNSLLGIADANPKKQGKFTAGTHILIESPERVLEKNPDYILLLAWNFTNEIVDILRNRLGFKGGIIIPLPNIPYIIEGTKDDYNGGGGIEGVKIIPLKRIPDERGVIMHGVRKDNILNDFGEVYFKKLYKDVVNGWHIHESLILNYICISGMIKLVLFDARKGSPTYGKIQEIFIGDDNYCLVHIPVGIANGMKGLSNPCSIICNVASEPHNPAIKYKRVDPHSGEIPYNWARKDF